MTIYRVLVEETTSKQPSRDSTHWRRTVLYVGTDATAARIAYHKSQPEDFGACPGSPARVTTFAQLDDEHLSGDLPGEFDT